MQSESLEEISLVSPAEPAAGVVPDCSVVIATHNRLALLQEALASALAQEDVDVEVIVVENGSSDGTPSYLRSLEDGRVRSLITEEALGATAARNLGLARARGRWLAFLDDDDVWAPAKLRSQIAAMTAAGRNWSYTGCVYIDRTGCVTAGTPPPAVHKVLSRLPRRYAIPAGLSSMVWRAGLLGQNGLLDQRLTYMVDWDLSLRLLRTGPPAIVNQPLVAYRQHGANMSVRAGSYLSEMGLVASKFSDLRDGRDLDVAYQHRNAGSEQLRAGNRRAALACYSRALRLGDLGAIPRAIAALLPAAAWPYLRRRVLAQQDWMREAEVWLEARARAPALAAHR
jgi:glycosyltransferase involved in cell wall biosynthesis